MSGNNDRFSRQITAASLAHVTPQRDRLCTYKIFNAAVFFVEVRHHLGKAAPLVVHIVTGKGQRDGGARVGGFVDGSDQLNGLAAFGTVYKQSFFPTDRPQEVEQLGRVAFTLEIGQIIVIFLQLFLFFPIFLGEAVDHGGVGRHVPRHCNAGLFAIEHGSRWRW